MTPLGYVVQQHSERISRPVKAYDRWLKQIPAIYRQSVLGEAEGAALIPPKDPLCLARLKHYRSLIPMPRRIAMLHKHPIF